MLLSSSQRVFNTFPWSPVRILSRFGKTERSFSSEPLQKRGSPVVGEKQISGPAPPPKNVTTTTLSAFKAKGQKFSMVTAYDYPSAVHADLAGIDVILVGDSVAMVELGYDNTLSATMDIMVHHAKAVSRGAARPLLVGDMPFGSYEVCKEDAVRNALRLLKEGRMDCVKLEGGAVRAPTVKAIVDAGIAVMCHVGLTPQQISTLGGFKAQGRTAAAARNVMDDALRLQDAGAFAVVLECVPAAVGEAITKKLEIPTIGIGAGPFTDGQVLVYHDLLGMLQHPHHAKVVPKFMKMYAHVGMEVQRALESYRDEVKSGEFPGAQFSPYKMPASELEAFRKLCASSDGIALSDEALTITKSKKKETSAEDGTTKLYG